MDKNAIMYLFDADTLEEMAMKAHFFDLILDSIDEEYEDDPGCEDGFEDDMEDGGEDIPEGYEKDQYIIQGGSFRLLVGDLYDLFVRHFNLERRLAAAKTEKDFKRIQKSASGDEHQMKRLCRGWGLPKDGAEPWAYDTLEDSLRKRILTPAWPGADHE